jgi:predicted nuclease of predicted toxin-antitoxin system
VRILLDENMPRKLLVALVAEGHEVDSVKSLQLQGIDNGALYQFAASNYDLCFTRDAEFSRRVQSRPTARLKLVRVAIPQTRQDEFVQQLISAFREADWSSHNSGDDWP